MMISIIQLLTIACYVRLIAVATESKLLTHQYVARLNQKKMAIEITTIITRCCLFMTSTPELLYHRRSKFVK